MKNNTLVLSLLLCVAPILQAATQQYTIDPLHSSVLWQVSHFGFSQSSGKWMAQGIIELDKDNYQNSQVNVTINVDDIVTGVKELDKHLKNKLFFDVQTYPQATFVSYKIEGTQNKVTKVLGNLTVRGITKPIVLEVKRQKKGINPITEKETIGFSASAQLKRSVFELNSLLPGVSDEVTLDIEVEAYQ